MTETRDREVESGKWKVESGNQGVVLLFSGFCGVQAVTQLNLAAVCTVAPKL